MQKFALVLLAASANALQLQDWKAAAQQSVDMGLHINNSVSDAFSMVADDGCERSKFIQWVSKFGREYKNSNEFEGKLKTWIVNNLTIKNFNNASVESGVHNAVLLDHNGFSDKTPEELDLHLGHASLEQEDGTELAQWRGRWRRQDDSDSSEEEDRPVQPAPVDPAPVDPAPIDPAPVDPAPVDPAPASVNDDDNREHLGKLTAGDIDWSWATKPVQAQGSCGSCWAFTGNTVLEATHYAYQNVTSDAERVRKNISHQHAVDCPGSAYYLLGCNGGDAERMWNFYQDEGTIDADSYPYASLATGVTGTCEADDHVKEYGLVQETGFVSGEDEMIAMIQERPLATAFNVASGTFSFYAFGLVKSGDGNCYTSSGTNHQMAVVGYDSVGQSGTHSYEVGDLYARAEGGWKGPCDPDAGEFLDPMYPGYCMYYVYHTEETFFDEGAFWKIQNSWGAGWGDQGFAYIEADGSSRGVCNMYQYDSQWVKTNLE